jgi:hypothetical protein
MTHEKREVTFKITLLEKGQNEILFMINGKHSKL